MNVQVCQVCGWSKCTTYHGLRVHQGKMGCTPKGMRIPESEQFRFSNNVNYLGPQIKIQEPFVHVVKSPVEVYKSPVDVFKSPVDVYKSPVEVYKSPVDSLFETPRRSQQTTVSRINDPGARRVLNFSSSGQQAAQFSELPATPALKAETGPTVIKMEKNREKDKIQKEKQEKMKADLQQKIHIRELKMAEVRSSVKDCKGRLDAEWKKVNNIFSDMVGVVEDARQKALKPLEDRRWKVKRDEQDIIAKLQREIDVLKETINESDRNPDLEVSPLTGLSDSDWKAVCVDTSLSFGTLRAVTSAMMKQIQQEIEKLSSIELKRISTFPVDVKLDPATAHQSLVLSDDGKTVRDVGRTAEGPDSPQRFDMFGSVLGLNRLTSGKSYWEVEVTNKTGWDLGVARRDANRKGILSLIPDNGYWVTVHYEDKKYAALTEPPVSLSLKAKPQKVGVFVDYEEGLVSFYDVTSHSHIFSFTECVFGGEILPYFSPHLKQNEKNTDPLIISAV